MSSAVSKLSASYVELHIRHLHRYVLEAMLSV